MAEPRERKTLPLPLKLAFSVASTLGLFLAAEGVASLALAWSDADDGVLAERSHCDFDPLLGWVNRPDVHLPDLYGPGRPLTTNSRGFRALEDYGAPVPGGRYRVICAGDSFTLGYGVGDLDTFPARLEALEPRLQVVNMGQGGYGVDQAYLWYTRDGVELESDLLLFVFIAPDFERMLVDRFQGRLAKPLLRVESGQVVLPEAPLVDDWEAGAGDGLGRFTGGLALSECFRRLARRSPPAATGGPLPYRELGEAILADLARLSRERGQDFALVHLPLRDGRAGNPEALLAWLGPYAEGLGVPLIDLSPTFDAMTPARREAQFLDDGHYDAQGLDLVARTLHAELKAHFPELP